MDSDARRILSAQHDRYPYGHGHRDLHLGHYSYENLWDRLRSPPFFLSALLLAFTVVYHLGLPQGRPWSLPDLLWDFLVSAIPARLLYAVDNWLNPPLFPRPMLLAPSPSPSHAAKSDVLQRILGTAKPTTLINSLTKLTSDTLATMPPYPYFRYNNPAVDGPPGLVNGGNRCFRNSVLQSLASLNPFIEFLANRPLPLPTADAADTKAVAPALHTLLTALNRPLSGGKSHIKVPRDIAVMDTGKQEDAYEYFQTLMDRIDLEMRDNNVSPLMISKIPTDPADEGHGRVPEKFKDWSAPRPNRKRFEGLIAQRVSCRKCGLCDGLKLVPFNCLTLSLNGAGEWRLQDCLREFTEMEVLDGVNCNKCTLLGNRHLLVGRTDPESKSLLSQIKQALEEEDYDDKTLKRMGKRLKILNGDKTREMAIARPPRLLALHISRSRNYGSAIEKNVSPVTFPTGLDLGPWLLGSAGRPAESDATPPKPDEDCFKDLTPDHVERWVTDPNSPLCSGYPESSKIRGPKYGLRSIVLHSGGQHQAGHYVNYRRFPAPKSGAKRRSTWYLTNDEWVQDATREEVLDQKGVFMLFYECVDFKAFFRPEPTPSNALPENPQTVPDIKPPVNTPRVRLPSVNDLDEEFPMRASDVPRDASHDGNTAPPGSLQQPESNNNTPSPEDRDAEESAEADIKGDL